MRECYIKELIEKAKRSNEFKRFRSKDIWAFFFNEKSLFISLFEKISHESSKLSQTIEVIWDG